jgi:hypothetical protein
MDGPGAFVGGVSESVTIVGAADSSAKSRVPVSASHVTVSANTNDTNDWIVLPTGVRSGHSITGWSVVAHEIRTEASSAIEINSEDCDGTKEAAIPATTLWRATYINSTIGWILNAWDELAAPITAIVPD